jgi:hypothetical protein
MPPHANAVGDDDPSGQQYPAEHNPEHADDGRRDVLP